MTHGLRSRTAGHGDDLVAERRRLVGLAVRFVWNRDDAEEIVQEAFRLALQGRMAAGDPHFGPWMNRTVTNLCLNHRRKRKPGPLDDEPRAAAVAMPGLAAETSEQLERLKREIERLPEQQQTALTLRAMQQMSYAEIAEIMELSEEAVRTHVHLARRALIERSDEGSWRS